MKTIFVFMAVMALALTFNVNAGDKTMKEVVEWKLSYTDSNTVAQAYNYDSKGLIVFKQTFDDTGKVTKLEATVYNTKCVEVCEDVDLGEDAIDIDPTAAYALRAVMGSGRVAIISERKRDSQGVLSDNVTLYACKLSKKGAQCIADMDYNATSQRLATFHNDAIVIVTFDDNGIDKEAEIYTKPDFKSCIKIDMDSSQDTGNTFVNDVILPKVFALDKTTYKDATTNVNVCIIK